MCQKISWLDVACIKMKVMSACKMVLCRTNELLIASDGLSKINFL